MFLKDEAEFNMIESKLQFDMSKGRWVAKYPWIRSPTELSNNRKVAIAVMKSTERRLSRNEDHKVMYNKQIIDMIDRNAAREVTEEELTRYTGPQFYLSHHAVMKPESRSTPCRIVFNSSAKYMGLSLNECLAKGPSLLNSLLGILIRFRQNQIAFIGDIKKMFHSIDIPLHDQMVHLFLWRDCDTDSKPTTYAMTAVNMGDRPSATIAQIALRKTAESALNRYPESANIILQNAYMDDIPGSVNTEQEAEQCMSEIDEILESKGFKIKRWFHNGNKSDTDLSFQHLIQSTETNGKLIDTEGVLGMMWNITDDTLYFKGKQFDVNSNYTKRTILSVTNSIYDPLGLLTPTTMQAKMIIRRIWAHEPKIGWDSVLPHHITKDWKGTLSQLNEIYKLSFSRAMCPGETHGRPILVIFSDASMHAYGAVAYIRWESKGKYTSRLVMAKNRMAPLKTIDIVRLELCGAVISVRIRRIITREMNLEFSRVIHLTDSEIVHAMLHRQSYGFNTFGANRIGEIQQSSSPADWGWISGDPRENISDIVTRGCSPLQLKSESDWQNGPSFLSLPEAEWPVRFEVNREVNVPVELKKSSQNLVATVVNNEESLANRIDCSRFSKWEMLVGVTARIMRMYRRYRKGGGVTNLEPTVEDRQKAELFWIKEAQTDLDLDSSKQLRPVYDEGLYTVGGRTERWMGCTWNQQKFILLPKTHHVSRLIAKNMHNKGGHLGISSSVSKVRSKYWIIGLKILMKNIISQCRKCKERLRCLQSQIMSPLPIERIKPCPAFTNVGIDYFGPFCIKGEVQKRVRGKAYGIIFTCFVSRAVYLDIANDYSTDGFLQVFRRYCSMRGWPAKIYSDQGTQLVGASNELKRTISQLDWKAIIQYGYCHQTEWNFAPADAQWYNGATEALVKTVKRALAATVGDAVMKFSELQTVMFEAAGLINERPIGDHPGAPEDGVYLSPNDLILGRSTARVPQGPFKERCSDKHRYDFIQSVISNFWKRWMREVFPNLVIQRKWHTEQHNLEIGDVVLVQDADLIRGQWKMALVEDVIPSKDNKVRRVMVTYKTEEGTRQIVERAVQKLILLVPANNS